MMITFLPPLNLDIRLCVGAERVFSSSKSELLICESMASSTAKDNLSSAAPALQVSAFSSSSPSSSSVQLAEDESREKNTDCVYFLASLLTRKKAYQKQIVSAEQEALYTASQRFVGNSWNGSDLYPDPCSWTPIQSGAESSSAFCSIPNHFSCAS